MTEQREIEFIQYLLPDGRTKPVRISCLEAIAQKADEIKAAGFRLECEILMTGEVSFTIFSISEEIDYAIEVAPNGPQVAEAVNRLVREFNIDSALTRCE